MQIGKGVERKNGRADRTTIIQAKSNWDDKYKMTCQGRGFNCQLVDGPTRILMKLFRDDDDDKLFTAKGDYRVKLNQIACVGKRLVTFLYPLFL